MNAPRFDRRQEPNFERYITFFAIVLNVAGIVWGAARITASVEQLNDTVKPLVIQVEQNKTDIILLQDHYRRLAP